MTPASEASSSPRTLPMQATPTLAAETQPAFPPPQSLDTPVPPPPPQQTPHSIRPPTNARCLITWRILSPRPTHQGPEANSIRGPV